MTDKIKLIASIITITTKANYRNFQSEYKKMLTIKYCMVRKPNYICGGNNAKINI